MELNALPNAISEQKKLGKKVVLVTGVFDVLHEEHERFLQKAKEHGAFLVVGLESDARVTQMKGPDRPINPQEKRKENLETLHLADAVFVLPETFASREAHEQLIDQLRPDLLAVSSHTKHLEEKERIMKKFGGALAVVHQQNPDISTTLLLEQQQKLQSKE